MTPTDEFPVQIQNHQKSEITQKSFLVFDQRPLNHSHLEQIEKIKKTAAILWDKLDNIPVAPGNNEAGRLISIAKTELESVVMWATKAISRT